MTLMLDIKLDTAMIRDWVGEAGAIAMRYFGNVNPEWKGVADPVTVADREIEQLLHARIREAFPDHGILGEEFGSEMLDREYVWTIDPIDGTRVYVEGLPSWNITIALLHQSIPVFGLVHMPMYNDWLYTDGDDVICNGYSVVNQLAQAWAADSYIFARSDVNERYDIRFTRIMALGSTASHLSYTARGASVATVTHDPYIWDIAAGAAILSKQGGEFRFLNGELVDFSKMDLTRPIRDLIVAGHPAVTQRLIPLITPHRAPITHPAW